jgi:hypothetical protein
VPATRRSILQRCQQPQERGIAVGELLHWTGSRRCSRSMTSTATGWRPSRRLTDHDQHETGYVTLLLVVACPAMHQRVWILDGYQSDFACNPAKKEALNFGGGTAAAVSRVGVAQG